MSFPFGRSPIPPLNFGQQLPVRDGTVRGIPNIPRGLVAKIVSLDTGIALMMATTFYARPPSRIEKRGGARWNEAGVAQASPQFSEYQQTNPQIWTLHTIFDASSFPGGVANDFESYYDTLHELTTRVPGKRRAHKCLYTQGKQRLKCVVEDYSVPYDLFSQSGGGLQAFEVVITLREIP